MGQVLAHFSQPLGRFGRYACRTHIKSLRWPVTITSVVKTLTQRHREVRIAQLQTLPVHPRAVTVPLHRVAPWPLLPGPAPKSAGSKGSLRSTFTKCFPLHVWEFKPQLHSPLNIHLFPAHKQNTLFYTQFCMLSGIFWAWRWIVMQMPLIFLGLSYSCGFQ